MQAINQQFPYQIIRNRWSSSSPMGAHGTAEMTVQGRSSLYKTYQPPEALPSGLPWGGNVHPHFDRWCFWDWHRSGDTVWLTVARHEACCNSDSKVAVNLLEYQTFFRPYSTPNEGMKPTPTCPFHNWGHGEGNPSLNSICFFTTCF